MDTFRTAMHLGPRALGAYVISMASSPSDILAVVLLQKTAATAISRCAPIQISNHFEISNDPNAITSGAFTAAPFQNSNKIGFKFSNCNIRFLNNLKFL